MKKSIPDATRAALLGTAWDLVAREGGTALSLTRIAQAAGVSRQTLFLAFGNRTALLTAMLRHRDAQSDHVARLIALGQGPASREAWLMQIGVWLDYLPLVQPVAVLLEAAALTDAEAGAAIHDRMQQALRAGFRRMAVRIAESEGPLAQGAPEPVADAIWALVHPQSWHLLVEQCGWTQEQFRADRLALAAHLMRAA